MKRLLTLAVLAAAWTGAATPSFAGTFGLCYSRKCGSCSFCVRPYNAFSPVASGNIDMSMFNSGSCRGPGCGGPPAPYYGGYPVGPGFDVGPPPCGPVGGMQINYGGVPANCASRGNLGYQGCGKLSGRYCAYADPVTGMPVAPIIPPSTPPGPPPAPYVTPGRNYCGTWFAPDQPMSAPGYSPMPWPAPKAPLVQLTPPGMMGGPAMQPVSYQPGYPGVGYQPAAWGAPAYGPQQGYPGYPAPGPWNMPGH